MVSHASTAQFLFGANHHACGLRAVYTCIVVAVGACGTACTSVQKWVINSGRNVLLYGIVFGKH